MSQRSNASLGRRLLPAVIMTSAASGLVALLDQPSSGAAVDLGGNAASPLETSTTAVAGASTATQPSAQPIQPPVVSSTVPAVVPQPSASSTPAAASAVCQGRTVDGPTIDTRWGPVQVEAVVTSGGQICNVDAIQSPNDHRRSVSINQQALPILHTEAMRAQSANINGVSGATITSRGYQSSLQSILDGLG